MQVDCKIAPNYEGYGHKSTPGSNNARGGRGCSTRGLAAVGRGYVVPAMITALAGILTIRLGRDDGADDESSDAPATTEHWQQLLTQMQAWMDKQVAERDDKIDQLDKRVTSLESRYRAALHFIRTLLRRHPDSSAEIPAEIRHDL